MFFYNLLLTFNFPIGKGKLCDRKKGDWFHSVLLLTNIDIEKEDIGEKIKCYILDFSKGPALNFRKDYITIISRGIYTLGDANGIIENIKTEKGLEQSKGYSDLNYTDIFNIAWEKWGNEKIPYAHNRNEGYNCIGFVDDIIHKLKYGKWNTRIENIHKKYKLF